MTAVVWGGLLPWQAVQVLIRNASWQGLRERMGWATFPLVPGDPSHTLPKACPRPIAQANPRTPCSDGELNPIAYRHFDQRTFNPSLASRCDPRYRKRLGIRTTTINNKCRLVLHAVSVGELAAAQPVLTRLARRVPHLEVILTVGNRDGLTVARHIIEHLPPGSRAMYLPWDREPAIRSFLETLKPRLVATVETEIWPILFNQCGRRGIPVCIVNGRVYPRDVARYRLVRGFMAEVLANTAWIGVQNEQERQRFLAIGAASDSVEVAGNAKYDAVIATPNQADPRLRTLAEIPDLVVAGSTHAPEECWLLEALAGLPGNPPLVLAPRRIGRVGALERLTRRHGLRTLRWSEMKAGESGWEVLLIDDLGWLPALYRYAAATFIGGSLVNRGGHNPLEAAAHGRAIVVGPHMQHFQGIVEELTHRRACIQLRQRHQLAAELERLLTDPDLRRSMGTQASCLVQSRRGCATRYAERLASYLLRPEQTRTPR